MAYNDDWLIDSSIPFCIWSGQVRSNAAMAALLIVEPEFIASLTSVRPMGEMMPLRTPDHPPMSSSKFVILYKCCHGVLVTRVVAVHVSRLASDRVDV